MNCGFLDEGESGGGNQKNATIKLTYAQVNTSPEYFLTDALGSVRQLTNSQGNLTLTQAYAPYGEVTMSSSSIIQQIRVIVVK